MWNLFKKHTAKPETPLKKWTVEDILEDLDKFIAEAVSQLISNHQVDEKTARWILNDTGVIICHPAYYMVLKNENSNGIYKGINFVCGNIDSRRNWDIACNSAISLSKIK